MIAYEFVPLTVAATVLARFRAAQSQGRILHRLLQEDGKLRVGRDLFVLSVEDSTLSSTYGHACLDPDLLARTEPDPLWDSADGICSHMEQDHADTFALFLQLAGRSAPASQALDMPWVQAEGFFLTTPGDHVFVPFPTPCPDANSVRATLIKMLRKARAHYG